MRLDALRPRTATRTVLGAIALTATCALAAGCSGGGKTTSPTTFEAVKAGDVTVLIDGESVKAEVPAGTGGTLQAGEGGCLGIKSPNEAITVVVFPKGSTASSDGTSVEVPDAGTLKVGEKVSLTGALYKLPETPERPEIPEQCLTDASYILLAD